SVSTSPSSTSLALSFPVKANPASSVSSLLFSSRASAISTTSTLIWFGVSLDTSTDMVQQLLEGFRIRAPAGQDSSDGRQHEVNVLHDLPVGEPEHIETVELKLNV